MQNTTRALRTLDDLDVEGRCVLVRADLNVPLVRDGDGAPPRVADDARIRASLTTLSELARRGGSVVLVSHLGRPENRDPALSMAPVAQRLAQLTPAPVTLAPAVVGEPVRAMARALEPGHILLLENVRFEPGETRNDPELAAALAELADLYVNDAFGTAHRAHASTEGVAHLLPSAAGRLLQREVDTLTAIVSRPARPLVTILGGAKVSDKIGVISRFLQVADVVCLGGAMAFPFLVAQGHDVGASRCASEDVEHAWRLLSAPAHARLELPCDLMTADLADPGSSEAEQTGVDIASDQTGLDIGPVTAQRYCAAIQAAGTVFWNGPMGRFELTPFASGTAAVARAIGESNALSVVGGGETVTALDALGDPARITHVSTGGGAMLEFLEGRTLPGVQALLAPAAVA